MNALVNAINNENVSVNKTVTTNGMPTYITSQNANLDLFYGIGSARKRNIIPEFNAAFNENSELAVKILLWSRDIREGAGERTTFRNILTEIIKNNAQLALKILKKIPELGRWDDVFVFYNTPIQNEAFKFYANALAEKNGLAAKWAPRKGEIAVAFTQFLGLTPRQYRKLIVGLSQTVEQDMCAKNWSNIDYSKVPSVASSRYMKAFYKNDSERYSVWRDGLKSGVTVDGDKVKINANVVYPYDITRALNSGADSEVVNAQWEALPNYMNDHSVLPVVDVSGSMVNPRVSGSVTALDVAVSLGLYTSMKSKGPFKDVFVTFSDNPVFMKLSGSLSNRMNNMIKSHWEMSTNIERVFDKLLDMSIKNNVSQEDMPKTILIMSDMQFNYCIKGSNNTVNQMIRVKYAEAGYNMPNVVFWNLNSPSGQSPVRFNETGVALVSGFSPTILKNILSGELDPMKIMLKTVDIPRYKI